MFKSFSNSELAAIAICLDEEEYENKKKRKIWVHDMLKKTEGEFFTLHKELVNDEIKFFQYFCMTKCAFYYILNKISSDLIRKNTTFRESITPLEKLCVCLR